MDETTFTPPPTPLRPADQPVLLPEDDGDVTLGTVQYPVREVPLARLRRVKKVWLGVFGALNELVTGADVFSEGIVDAIVGLFEDNLGDIITILYPSFDAASMLDEDHGPSLPQVKTALDRALTVNGLDALKRAIPFVVGTVQNEAQTRAWTRQAEAIKALTEAEPSEKTS